MNEYRLRDTGEVKSEKEIRLLNAGKSLPKVLSSAVLEILQIDSVLIAPSPVVTNEQIARRNGVIQDALGNWVQSWEVVPKFTDIVIDGEVITTVSEQISSMEKAANIVLVENKKEKVRADFLESLAGKIVIRAIEWDAGFDSALAIDGATRLSENAGLSVVTLHDATNAPHQLSISEAKNLAVVIGGDYQEKFSIKQSRMLALSSIDLDHNPQSIPALISAI